MLTILVFTVVAAWVLYTFAKAAIVAVVVVTAFALGCLKGHPMLDRITATGLLFSCALLAAFITVRFLQ